MTIRDFAEIELLIMQFATENNRCVTTICQTERVAVICNNIFVKGRRITVQEANDMDVARMGVWVDEVR